MIEPVTSAELWQVHGEVLRARKLHPQFDADLIAKANAAAADILARIYTNTHAHRRVGVVFDIVNEGSAGA